MSKNLVINGVTYNGIESMEINDVNGKKVTYVASDEVIVDLPDPNPAAGPGDIAAGKQALDGNGEIMTGNVPEVANGQTKVFRDVSAVYFEDPDYPTRKDTVAMSVAFDKDTLIREGGEVVLSSEWTQYGDAQTGNVDFGVTFTSKYGLRLVGTRLITEVAPPLSEMLPDLNNPADVGDVLLGKEFIDADGVKRTGTLVPSSGGGGLETIVADIAVYTGASVVMYYMGTDGLQFAESPNGQFEIVKNSPVVIIYDGSTSLTNQGGSGYIQHYDNAWQYTGHSCAVISFFENGSVIYAEN